MVSRDASASVTWTKKQQRPGRDPRVLPVVRDGRAHRHIGSDFLYTVDEHCTAERHDEDRLRVLKEDFPPRPVEELVEAAFLRVGGLGAGNVRRPDA